MVTSNVRVVSYAWHFLCKNEWGLHLPSQQLPLANNWQWNMASDIFFFTPLLSYSSTIWSTCFIKINYVNTIAHRPIQSTFPDHKFNIHLAKINKEAITETTIMVPYLSIKSLQLSWTIPLSYQWFMATWQGTWIVSRATATMRHTPLVSTCQSFIQMFFQGWL